MVTRDAQYPAIAIFQDEVKYNFYSVDHGNRYLPRSSKEEVLSIIIVGNVSFC